MKKAIVISLVALLVNSAGGFVFAQTLPPPTEKDFSATYDARMRQTLATFPDLTFLQLLFGFRSLRELEAAFPDCLVRTPEARALLNALFPKTPSDIWPVI